MCFFLMRRERIQILHHRPVSVPMFAQRLKLTWYIFDFQGSRPILLVYPVVVFFCFFFSGFRTPVPPLDPRIEGSDEAVQMSR